MESIEKGNVKNLVSRFLEKETSADSKDKDKKLKKPKTKPSGSLRARSEQSIEIPLAFKDARPKKPEYDYPSFETESDLSSKDIPPHFSDRNKVSYRIPKHWEKSRNVSHYTDYSRPKKPECDYPSFETESDLSSKDIPPHFSDRNEVSYRIPKHWEKSRNVPHYTDYSRPKKPECDYPSFETESDLSSKDIPPHFSDRKVNVQVSPSVAYPVLRTDHVDYNRLRQNYPRSVSSSDTSDYSSVKSKGSQSSDDTVLLDHTDGAFLCDVCSLTTAVKTCLTCNNFFCESHAWDHLKTFPRHILTDVSEEVKERRCPHIDIPLDFFCRTDQIHICSICVKGNHRRHDIIPQREHQTLGDEGFGELHAAVPPPGQIKFLMVRPNSVELSWGLPQKSNRPKSFRVKWSSLMEPEGSLVIKDYNKVEINNLELGQRYFFCVASEDEEGNLSEWVKAHVSTGVPPPRHLTKGHSDSTSLSLNWTRGENMEGIPHQFVITVTSPGKEPLVVHTKDCNRTFSNLEPDTEYKFSVSTVLSDKSSDPVSISAHTEPCFRKVLSKVGLEHQYDNKLSIRSVLQMNENDMLDSNPETPESLPEAFLKSLLMLNSNARSMKCVFSDLDTDKKNAVNPLDLITALFLCSDSFLQQNIVGKMVSCQFAIPLLLPNSESKELIMVLWSMREIVRSVTPVQRAFRKLSCEDRLVRCDFPLISFVRLGKRFLSKSETLNKLFSNTEQYHDIFHHSDVPRKISDGLVEISWYLPCGIGNIDKFSEPLAVINLRGDIVTFDKQFSLFCQTSAAVYIFCEESQTEYLKNLQGKQVPAKVILISSVKGESFRLKRLTVEPSFKTTNISESKSPGTELLKALQDSISKILQNKPIKVSLEDLAERARCCQILVDEDSDECRRALMRADKITACVNKIPEFKERELPCQGNIWKALSWLETEKWRLRNVGNQNTEEYQKSLESKEKELKKQQRRFDMTRVMSNFLRGLGASEVERHYFLKWMEMKLADLSREQVSALQHQYKELKQKSPQKTEKIAEVDQQISIGSLGVKHFFRECGQQYSCASGLPEFSSRRKKMERLPALCAQMLLVGFPLELVDGDAANVPMKWVTDVLTELHDMMQSHSKVKVISVVGEENSGKSTLFNTVFGVGFAINKGTCTRGAFIQLIRVSKGLRKELGCDCVVVIDTEGLKPRQMVQDDHSHQRDKEVASLAVGLSDITVVSVSKDSSAEKDTLKMVLHALTRLKDADQKPLCHFVHLNAAGISLLDRKKRDEELLQQLNVMIQTDAQTNQSTKLSDVIELDPNTWSWYFPPVWSGTPPMASYSVDYSQTANTLKKQLLKELKKRPARGDLTDFGKRLENIWKVL